MTQRQRFTHRVGRQVDVLILACALASFCSTLYCTGRYGSAIWAYWRALRSTEIDAGERPLAQSQSEGDVSRLREEAIHWEAWRGVSAQASLPVMVVSLLAVAV